MRSVWLPVVVIVVCCLGVEGILIGADFGQWGTRYWRPTAYQYGGFWSGLLYGWQPNYVAQPYTMFLSYGFLHAGYWHLLGNIVALVGVARALTYHMRANGFVLLYVSAQVGGALGFALLSPAGFQPVVGASGAIFGLVGAWLVMRLSWSDQRNLKIVLLKAGGSMAALNLIAWASAGGPSAWQVHLGGGLTGLFFGLFYLRTNIPNMRS